MHPPCVMRAWPSLHGGMGTDRMLSAPQSLTGAAVSERHMRHDAAPSPHDPQPGAGGLRVRAAPTKLRRLSLLEELCIETLCHSAHLHQTDYGPLLVPFAMAALPCSAATSACVSKREAAVVSCCCHPAMTWCCAGCLVFACRPLRVPRGLQEPSQLH